MMFIIEAVVKKGETVGISGLEVLEQVNSFYNSAWDKLIVIVTISFGIVGIAIPLLLQWYQRKVLILSEDKLLNNINSETTKVKEDLKREILIELNEKFEEYEQKINKTNASLSAKTFHLQASSYYQQNIYPIAYADLVQATSLYLKAEDYVNIQATLSFIESLCLPVLTVEDINDIKTEFNQDILEVIENIVEKDVNKVLRRQTQSIKLKLSKLPDRKETKTRSL